MFERLLSGIVLVILSPLFLALSFLILVFCGKPIFFKQKRYGKNKRTFVIYKFRTMSVGGEKERRKYSYLNEADGPVFKIKNDPRYTKIGKIISHLGLDELPQLINIIKGDMAFVGPRPLPVEEAAKISKQYQARFSVLPGITSLWVIRGGHSLSFDAWMRLDLLYIHRRSFMLDVTIMLQTAWLFLRVVRKSLFH